MIIETFIDDLALCSEMIKGGPMSRKESDLREPRAPEGMEMIAFMRQGVVEALREHRAEGRPVVTWDYQTRRIVEVLAVDIVIPDDSMDPGMA